MQYIASGVLVFLIMFLYQSLTILLFKHSVLMKFIPLVLFIIPFSSIRDIVSNSPEQFTSTLMTWIEILIPLLLGDILSWIMGFHFRKIIDQEHKEKIAKYEENERDHDQTE